VVACVRGWPHRLFGLAVPGGRVVAVVAARRASSPAFGRRTAVRRYRARLAAASGSVLALVFGFIVAGALGVATTTPASAQGFTYNPRPPRPVPPRAANDGQMLVQAVEVDYDYNNSRVSAVGNVQLFYNGTSVEADKVIYDQKTKRLHAEGNIRMTDADGKITYAEIMDLSDDYRDGFVDSLRVDTADQTRMAASRADRSSGNYTVFENGVYTACAPCRDDPKKPPLWQVKGARIIHDQLDPSALAGQPGDRQFRGAVDTKGQFALNDKWVWGWDGVLMSDYYFFSDYRLSQYRDPLGSFLYLPTDALSQLYLTGVGNRSFFDARTMYWLSYSGNQSQVPVVYPVIDYSNVLNYPVFGGEFSYKTNFVNLSRDAAVFDPITTVANTNSLCTTTSADPLARTPSQCLLRGVPGTYTRLTAEAQWRKSFTDPFGEIWTPFAILRADAIDASISNQPGVSNFLPVGDPQALRPMPAVGLEYRYPFINVQPWGTTTIEPIAQIIARPNETYAGKLPNEDAQSMVFDASNLFAVDKFSGYDRVEGGGRANVGVQATTQFDRGGSINMLFGQSYQLFGLNSFAVADVTNTGIDSGLQNTSSDYVARVNYTRNRTYTFSTRARFDEATGNVNRFEAEGRATFDRWAVSMMYGNYAAQPELGYLTRREGLLGSASIKVAANWVVSGAARWDLEANKVNQYIVGAGYVDDCFVLAANYVTSYNYSAGSTPPTLNHTFMLQIGLRTIANSTSAGGAGGGIQ